MDWSQMVSEPNQQPRVAVSPKGPKEMIILIFAGEEQSASHSTSANTDDF